MRLVIGTFLIALVALCSMIELYAHQREAIKRLRSGSILCGGVGSGKSLTAVAYYDILPRVPLYIITTARKRDTHEWDFEVENFKNVWYVVDSWNNIGKYTEVQGAFFIFDEQRVVGSGSWVKSFLKICKNNQWILLSATPGDSWMDYIPVFIANGFYRNRTEFIRRHVVFNPRVQFPKVERYLDEDRLRKLKAQILVTMDYKKATETHHIPLMCSYDRKAYFDIVKRRWNPWKDEPICNAGEYCYALRKVVNSDPSRIDRVVEMAHEHDRIIIFYNFDYELELLREIDGITIAEWNGHKHESIPDKKRWLYLVQYNSGAEGWNCILTNCIIFYSPNYSYKMMVQAAGRTDRINTPFANLYCYYLHSDSIIDLSICKALEEKRDFNENKFSKFPSQKKHTLL